MAIQACGSLPVITILGCKTVASGKYLQALASSTKMCEVTHFCKKMENIHHDKAQNELGKMAHGWMSGLEILEKSFDIIFDQALFSKMRRNSSREWDTSVLAEATFANLHTPSEDSIPHRAG